MKQHTIRKRVSVNGVGLHTGKHVTMTFLPAAAGHGIKFMRTDLEEKPVIPADVANVASTNRNTTLMAKDAQVSTVEHTLAALVGLEIDNVLIEIDGPEAPIMDGSAMRASTRLWQHSEAKARQCSGLAFEGRIDPLEAYLGGLLHNSGWAVALNGLDRDGRFATGLASGPMGFSDAFAAALPDRCDRLFGRIAAGWALTPALSALADSALASDGLAGSHQPLAMLLRRADTATTALLAMPAAAHPT